MPRWLLAFSLVVSACDVDIPEGRIACETAADCPTGWYCVVDRCYSTPGDAGCPDCDAGCTDCGDAGCTSDAECDDGLDCTEDVCTGGACRNDLLVDRCLIDGACLEAGALGAECRECAPAISTTAWSASAPSSSCQTTGGASGTCEGLDGAPLCCAGATRVSAGATHTCSIRTDGSLYCWGSNAGGQLGVGDTTYRALPTRVGVDADWTHLATTHSQTCALRSSGALYCWGIVGGAITPAPARVGSDSD
ncbi:MAG: hypothetical protein M5U28_43580 [Sandaracinaceae bacterium]|nr:hypothetical protein [Sandaracinaceae bacterium]